jgi:hypothetical protein
MCSDLKSEVFGYHAVPVPHKEVDLVAKEGMRVIDGADTPWEWEDMTVALVRGMTVRQTDIEAKLDATRGVSLTTYVTGAQTQRECVLWVSLQTDKQADRQTVRQTDRQTDREPQ